ncbi:hypothetical protein QPK87_30000 [Kamptonema cortianum]|nr:hypothetical protein [Kamptonema cortianum]
MVYERLETLDRDETPETWLWCLHCERCYQLKETRVIDDLQMAARHKA